MRDSADVIPLQQTPFSGKSPNRSKNADTRPRKYLTEDEVEQLMKTGGSVGRHGLRDAILILVAYRHGLRVSVLVALKWSQVDLKQGHLAVVRAKNGTDSTHFLAWARDSRSQATQARVRVEPTSSSPSAEGRSRRPLFGK